jgi:hypothetical protein
MSACRIWNEKEPRDKDWTNFKVHAAAAHHQHNQIQIQGESATNSGYHAGDTAMGQTEDQMAEATIGAVANLATTTVDDCEVVSTLTEANARLARQLEECSK